jgi:hypothetical protein
MHRAPALRRTEAWYRQQAEKGRRELQQLFDESAASRTAAARMYPHLTKSFRQVDAARPQQTAPSAASRMYPHLAKERR